jgi:hypothetical protein
MKAEDLAKSGTESGHQRAVFCWAQQNEDKYPELKWLHAIPNGGSRGDDERSRAIRGANLKAEGVKAGVPDIFLPVPRYKQSEADSQVMQIEYCGLYIEMKKPGVNKASKEQLEFKEFIQKNRYGWILCDNWITAVANIEAYLKG